MKTKGGMCDKLVLINRGMHIDLHLIHCLLCMLFCANCLTSYSQFTFYIHFVKIAEAALPSILTDIQPCLSPQSMDGLAWMHP